MQRARRATGTAIFASLAIIPLVGLSFSALVTWPGGSAVSTVDAAGEFSGEISGLTYPPSGGVMWAVQNDPPTLYRLVKDGAQFKKDTNNGWSNGKALYFTDGKTDRFPDAEGVTLAGGDANAVYVSVERDDQGGGSPSRPAVLRYDVSGAGAGGLTATMEWNLSADLPGLGGNAGLEGVTWIADDVLVAKNFVDESTGAKYNPATHANHGSGLFFVAVEDTGDIVAYAFDLGAGTATRVARIDSGFSEIMEVAYDAQSKLLWAMCDDHCQGRSTTLDVAASGGDAGHFVVTNTYDRPGDMGNLNTEGFTITPAAECAGGVKPVYFADDDNTASHSLRAGTLNCGVTPTPTSSPTSSPTASPTGTATATATTTATPTATPTPRQQAATPTATPTADPAPTLKLALKFTKSGTLAVRKTGKFGVTITLGEKADLTISATARRSTKAKARTIYKATRKSVAAGKTTVTLSLSRSVRSKLRKGETVTLTIQARDTAGNVTTSTAKAKVP